MKKRLIFLIIILLILMSLTVPKINYATDVTSKMGDVNSDGLIDSRDILKMLQHISASTISKIGKNHPDWILNNEKYNAGDINEDGVIDSRDILKELEYIAASTIPKIGQKNPGWKKYIESKWTKDLNDIRKLVLEQTSITIEKGKTQKIIAKIIPESTVNKTIAWSSSDSSVAIVDGLGNVTGMKNGLTIITAKTADGLSKTCQVKVVEANKIEVSNISIMPSRQTIKKGSYLQLQITIQPTNATDKTITWSTDKPNVATVSTTGKVYAVNAGNATITAKTKNGKTSICNITITANTTYKPEDEKIKVNGKTITKGQYANFRNVCTGKIAPNVLYRCINPICPYSDKQKMPAYYADRLLEAHKVNVVLSLSDSISKMKKKGYSKSTYYKKLLNAGKVHVYQFKDDGTYGTKEKKKIIVKGLRVFVKNKGPYAVHCKWGQGRTGFVIMLLECLMDAPYEYMYNDFILSFKNLHNGGSYNKEFSKYMKIITGKGAANSSSPKASDWKNVNFVKCAEKYLKDGGMTDAEIQTLKNNLS